MRRALVLVLVGLWGVPVAPAAADDGPWGWPLDGPHEVVRDFEPPVSRYGVGHRGVDLPATPGAAVRASAAGQVTWAGRLAGRGVVVVTHGALRTTYEPVSAAVPLGAAVERGEVVGQVEPGHAGCPVAACLHWGLRRGEDYLDPVRLVERGPVRLLPLDVAAPAAALLREAPGAVPEPVVQTGPVLPDQVTRTERLTASRSARRPESPASQEPEPVAERESATDAESVSRREPAHEPAWSVRAAEAPLGMAAVVALVLGIGLLARPRPAPDDPGSGSGGVAGVTAPPPQPSGPPAALLDLDAARLRRRAS